MTIQYPFPHDSTGKQNIHLVNESANKQTTTSETVIKDTLTLVTWLYNGSQRLHDLSDGLLKLQHALINLANQFQTLEYSYQKEKEQNRYSAQHIAILHTRLRDAKELHTQLVEQQSQLQTELDQEKKDNAQLAGQNRSLQQDLDDTQTAVFAHELVGCESQQHVSVLPVNDESEPNQRIAELEQEVTGLNELLANAMSIVLDIDKAVGKEASDGALQDSQGLAQSTASPRKRERASDGDDDMQSPSAKKARTRY